MGTIYACFSLGVFAISADSIILNAHKDKSNSGSPDFRSQKCQDDESLCVLGIPDPDFQAK